MEVLKWWKMSGERSSNLVEKVKVEKKRSLGEKIFK